MKSTMNNDNNKTIVIDDNVTNKVGIADCDDCERQRKCSKGSHRPHHRHSIAIQVDAASTVALGMSSITKNICNDDNCTRRIEPAEPESSPLESQPQLQPQQQCCTNPSSRRRILRDWIVEDKDVKEIPEIYPRLSYPLVINRSSSSLAADDDGCGSAGIELDIGLIGHRLLMFLNGNNIRSVYDEHRGRVYCLSPKVSFVVQFWRRRRRRRKRQNTNTTTTTTSMIAEEEEEEEIILEIQRRQGCSFTLQKIRTALKRSILPNSNKNRNRNRNSKYCCNSIIMTAQHQHHNNSQHVTNTTPPAMMTTTTMDGGSGGSIMKKSPSSSIVRYESLLKSYRPSRHIKMMYERQREEQKRHLHHALPQSIHRPSSRSRLLSAPPRLLAQSIPGIDPQLFSSSRTYIS